MKEIKCSYRKAQTHPYSSHSVLALSAALSMVDESDPGSWSAPDLRRPEGPGFGGLWGGNIAESEEPSYVCFLAGTGGVVLK